MLYCNNQQRPCSLNILCPYEMLQIVFNVHGMQISKHVSRITKASFHKFLNEKICLRRIMYFAITNIASHFM